MILRIHIRRKNYFGGGWLPEGSQIYVQLITQGVAAGTELYWRAEGTGIDDNDFTNNASSGSAIVGARNALMDGMVRSLSRTRSKMI